MSSINGDGPPVRPKLSTLLGPALTPEATAKLNAAGLEKLLQGYEQGWRRWLAAEHGSRGPAQGTPDKATLERAIPVLRVLVEAKKALEHAEDHLTQRVREQVRGKKSEIRSAHTAHSVAPRDLALLDLGVELPYPPRPSEVEGSRLLVERRYRELGYLDGSQAYNWAPGALPLVACADGKVIATVSIIVNEEVLPLEQVFPAQVAALRAQGLRLAEVGAFASDPESPSKAQTHATMTLVDVALETLRRSSSFDAALLAVHPHHAGFYERRLGAKRLTATPMPHPKVKDAPAVLLMVGKDSTSRAVHQEIELLAGVVAACID